MKFIRFSTEKAAVLAGAVLALSVAGRVGASAFVYQFSDAFVGSGPEGTAPWLDVTFSDLKPGVVQMTIGSAGMTTAESLESLLLNFDPSDSLTGLAFAKTSQAGSFTLPTVSTGADSFKANGDGKYDIALTFSTKASQIFTTGDSVTYDVTSSALGTGLTASDFDYVSAPSAGGAGPFLAAAEFKCTSSTETEWVAPPGLTPVPEPGTWAIFAAGATVWAGSRWIGRRGERRRG